MISSRIENNPMILLSKVQTRLNRFLGNHSNDEQAPCGTLSTRLADGRRESSVRRMKGARTNPSFDTYR